MDLQLRSGLVGPTLNLYWRRFLAVVMEVHGFGKHRLPLGVPGLVLVTDFITIETIMETAGMIGEIMEHVPKLFVLRQSL
jgi:hypothetical protein